ncbi:leucine-rich repeat protein [Clostridium sp. DL1XJH146]
MTKNKVCEKNRGFTLIELIITLAVIAIIATIAIPNYLGILSNSKKKADTASLKTLNSATSLYRTTYPENDPFASSDESDYLMSVLIPEFLVKVAEPQQSDVEFTWNLDSEKWELIDSQGTVTPASDFSFNSSSGIIESYDGTSTDLVIPSEIDGVTVTGLAFRALDSIGLTSLVLPDTLTSINKFSFRNNELETVEIPGSVETINVLAFDNNNLKEITLNEGLKVIADTAFANNELTSITLPDSVTYVDNYAFAYNAITEITIGSGVTLNDTAFTHNDKGDFISYYNNDSNKEAGTYVYSNGRWEKK